MYTLILFMFIGVLSEKDSMALTNIEGFKTKQQCELSGQQTITLFAKGTKEGKYICVEVNK